MTRLKFLAIVFIQICVFLYIASQKYGYQCDELWTYNISNGENTLVNEAIPFSPYLNKEIDKKIFRDFYRADGNALFDFTRPWKNSHFDSHPPLYYCVIHFVTSLFSFIDDNINTYIGIIPNLIFFLIIQVFVFLITKEITNNTTACFLSIFLYGFSLGCMDAMLIIRMYSMLTLLICIYFYIHIIELKHAICKQKISNKFLVCSFITFIIGFLTHLYFLIIAFFISIVLFMMKITKKAYGDALKYAVVMLSSIISSLVLCQDILLKIFGTNVHTAHIAKSLGRIDFFSNFYGWLFVLDRYTYFIVFSIIIGIYILLYSIYKNINITKGDFGTNCLNAKIIDINISLYINPLSLYILFVVLFAVAVISKVTLYMSPRYVICLTPFCYIFFVILAYDNIFNCVQNKKLFILATLCILMLNNIVKYKDIMWLNFEQKRIHDIIRSNNCPDKLLIVVKKNVGYEGAGEDWWPTISATQLSLDINKTYITYSDNINNIGNMYSKENNLLLYIDSRIDKNLTEKIIDSLNFKNKKFLHEFNEYQGNVYLLNKF